MEDLKWIIILQVDIQVEGSHEHYYYMFSENRDHNSVQDLLVKVSHIKILKECSICVPHSKATKCKCPLSECVGVYEVSYGNGCIVQLSQHEHFNLELYDVSTPCAWGIPRASIMRDMADTTAMVEMVQGHRQARIQLDGYQCSYFLAWLRATPLYVEQLANNYVTKRLHSTSVDKIYFGLVNISFNQLKIDLVETTAHPLIMTAARMAIKKVNERREIQSAMAVLSTFGGALSALGDHQEKCAVAAGQISVEQFRLAYMLGDKALMAQCRLYFAMSMIQRGKLSLARQVIYEQYMNQRNLREPDLKTLNMCHGIWARLKHEYARRRALRPKQFPRIVCPPPLGGLRPVLGRWRLMMI